MNYLSHFWLDEHQHDPAFSVGGALPDIARLRGLGFRLRPGGVEELSPIQASIEAGIARHYEIDAHWHNHAIFHALAAQVKVALAEAGIQLRRTSFACHIGAEMILDRVLLQDDPGLANRFYACFTPFILEEVYALTAAKGHADWLPKLREGMERFVQRRFLAEYAGDYLSHTWPGIYGHVTGDAVAQAYPSSQWMAVVDALTERFMIGVDWDRLRTL